MRSVSFGERNAYRSVLSANGSFDIIGASLWLDDISAAAIAANPRKGKMTLLKIDFFCIKNVFLKFENEGLAEKILLSQQKKFQ